MLEEPLWKPIDNNDDAVEKRTELEETLNDTIDKIKESDDYEQLKGKGLLTVASYAKLDW